MTAPRTVTLPLVDGGTVTLTCPRWCIGHSDAPMFRADIAHEGRELDVQVPTNDGNVALIAAALEWAPFSEVGTRRPYVSLRVGDGDHYRFTTAASLYAVAEDLVAKVRGVLRAAGDQLARALDETGDGQ